MRRCASLAMLCVVAIAACDKNARQDITAPAAGANVKFFNFSVGSPGVNFYAGASKVTAITSTLCAPPNDTTAVCRANGVESTVGTGYNAAADGALYSEITPGQVTFAGKIAAVTDNGLAVATAATSVDNSKYYSFYMSGIYNTTTKTTDAFIIEDPIPSVPDFTQAYVRFVNAISNSQPMALYVKNTVTGTETAIGAAATYKTAGVFTAVPAAAYDLASRASGSSTNLITRTAVSFVAGHVYTVTAYGDMTATTGTAKPGLDNTANR